MASDAQRQWVQRALGVAFLSGGRDDAKDGPTSGVQPQGKFVTMQKSRLIWDAARKRVTGEVQALKAAVAAASRGDAQEAEIKQALASLDDVIVRFDERLLDKLDEMLNTSDQGAHARLTQQARDIIADYVSFTQTEPLVQMLEGTNPFGVKLSVASTMAATLKALQASVI